MLRVFHRSAVRRQLARLKAPYKPLTLSKVRTASGIRGKTTEDSTEPQFAEFTTLETWDPRRPIKPLFCRADVGRLQRELWTAYIQELRSISSITVTSPATSRVVDAQLIAAQRHYDDNERNVGLSRILERMKVLSILLSNQVALQNHTRKLLAQLDRSRKAISNELPYLVNATNQCHDDNAKMKMISEHNRRFVHSFTHSFRQDLTHYR